MEPAAHPAAERAPLAHFLDLPLCRSAKENPNPFADEVLEVFRFNAVLDGDQDQVGHRGEAVQPADRQFKRPPTVRDDVGRDKEVWTPATSRHRLQEALVLLLL